MGSDRSTLMQYRLRALFLIILTQLGGANNLKNSTFSTSTVVPCSKHTTGTLNKELNYTRGLNQSLQISATKTQSPSTITARNRDIKNETRPNQRGCSSEPNDECPRFVDKYSSFYFKIGGWLMLGVVLAGIIALVVTHFLGMRHMRRPRHRELSRILWVEALTKNKLARFV